MARSQSRYLLIQVQRPEPSQAHLEFDTNQLDKVQHRAAHFVKKYYHRNSSVIRSRQRPMVAILSSQQDEACFFSTKVFTAFLQFHATHFAGWFLTPNTHYYSILPAHISSCKYGLIPRTVSNWNKLSQNVRSKWLVASFCSDLLKLPRPVKTNFSVSIAGYLEKNCCKNSHKH